MSEQVQEIKLSDEISLKNNLTKTQVEKYLRPLMAVEDLGDCLFVHRIGKFTTFKIQFSSCSHDAEIITITQTCDAENNNMSNEIFKKLNEDITDCSECSGSGNVMATCEECMGTGGITDVCEPCNGDGSIEIGCEKCVGSGETQ